MVTVTEATITCPECGYASSETMPTNACQCKSVHDVVTVNAAEWCENELHLLWVPAVPEEVGGVGVAEDVRPGLDTGALLGGPTTRARRNPPSRPATLISARENALASQSIAKRGCRNDESFKTDHGQLPLLRSPIQGLAPRQRES